MVPGLPLYRASAASKAPLIDFMVRGLEQSDCRVLHVSPANQAPSVISFEGPDGARMGIIAYAFRATRTPTRNRPADERSFQIKYGDKRVFGPDNIHQLYQDPLGLFTTILVGIDPEEGFFVSADPEAHNPTRMFIRLEFKDEHAEAVRSKGWHAWERSKLARGPLAPPVEVLVGGRQEHFLDLVRFERAAYGMAPGERQLLADRMDMLPGVMRAPADAGALDPAELHPLLREFDMDADAVLELIANARRLKMAVRGWVAEEHLRATLAKVDDVSDCERLDIEGGADIRLRYRGGPPLSIECKNVLRVPAKRLNLPRIDFQRTRAAKGDPCSRYYAPSDFDIVAGCLHAITTNWEFRYVVPSSLDPHRSCDGKLASNVIIDERWSNDPRPAFEAAMARLGYRA